MNRNRLAVVFVVALVAGLLAPLTMAQSGPVITTYDVPIIVEATANITVPAGQDTNNDTVIDTPGIATHTLDLGFDPSPTADVILYYSFPDNTSNIDIVILDAATGATISTVLLSSGSPSTAIVPLNADLPRNVTVQVTNSNGIALNATVTITVVEVVRFEVSVDRQHVYVAPGESATITVTVRKVSGPSGTISFRAESDGPFTFVVDPDQVLVSTDAPFDVSWQINVDVNARQGTYTARLIGTFTPDATIPTPPPDYPYEREFTFAEIAFPIAVEAAIGVSGFALGALFGASFGWWAVAIAVLVLIAIVYFVFAAKK